MNCYKTGGCGPYENRPCNECPARKPEYLFGGLGEAHEQKPLTNYDRLISKSPEELAEFFQVHCCPFELCGLSNWECKHDCKQCWLDWLRQEVEGAVCDD